MPQLDVKEQGHPLFWLHTDRRLKVITVELRATVLIVIIEVDEIRAFGVGPVGGIRDTSVSVQSKAFTGLVTGKGCIL